MYTYRGTSLNWLERNAQLARIPKLTVGRNYGIWSGKTLTHYDGGPQPGIPQNNLVVGLQPTLHAQNVMAQPQANMA